MATQSIGNIQTGLLAWYDQHQRALAWRAFPGETVDPYLVWLSEIMLQQTTVAAVGKYYRDFTARWPTVIDLAAASLDAVLQRWAGLGYYARARNLHKCAQVVAGELNGVFPGNAHELAKLPGIGPYTAGAIAAIAFDEAVAAVDGNVERVVARLYAIETVLPDAKSEIRAIAERLVPAQRPGDFAQAMMDLGATVCMPRRANCEICPLNAFCIGREQGIAQTLPRRKAKKRRPVRHGTVFWLERDDGAVLLRRRAETGLLGGMMEVPSSEWLETGHNGPAGQALVPGMEWQEYPAVVEHTFTHFHLKLAIVRASVAKETVSRAPADCKWVMASDLNGHALPQFDEEGCGCGFRC